MRSGQLLERDVFAQQRARRTNEVPCGEAERRVAIVRVRRIMNGDLGAAADVDCGVQGESDTACRWRSASDHISSRVIRDENGIRDAPFRRLVSSSPLERGKVREAVDISWPYERAFIHREGVRIGCVGLDAEDDRDEGSALQPRRRRKEPNTGDRRGRDTNAVTPGDERGGWLTKWNRHAIRRACRGKAVGLAPSALRSATKRWRHGCGRLGRQVESHGTGVERGKGRN